MDGEPPGVAGVAGAQLAADVKSSVVASTPPMDCAIARPAGTTQRTANVARQSEAKRRGGRTDRIMVDLLGKLGHDITRFHKSNVLFRQRVLPATHRVEIE